MPDISGPLRKMKSELTSPVTYHLPVGDNEVPLTDAIGKTLRMTFDGAILCVHCGRKTKKSFSQGYCFPCMRKLAQCDNCIVRPETCHYHEGTCREPQWGETNCMTDTIVYLANSSGLKVGITRRTQVPTRWIDQGARQALPIIRANTRLQSGLIESALKKHVSDKTDWRRMLKGQSELVDLESAWETLKAEASDDLAAALENSPVACEPPEHLSESPVQIDYPVNEYPEKVKSMTFDKLDTVEGTLMGIKGQYLILDTGVINMRRHSGYVINVAIG